MKQLLHLLLSPESSQPLICSLCGFACGGYSYKWNHILCGLGDWLLPLSKAFSRFIHVVARSSTLFLLMMESYSILQVFHLFHIHSSVSGHLGRFYRLTILTSAAMNMSVHIALRNPAFNCLGVSTQA